MNTIGASSDKTATTTAEDVKPVTTEDETEQPATPAEDETEDKAA